VLSYVQEAVAAAWKNNLLDKLSKKKSEIEIVEELFGKMRNEFGKIAKEKRKIEQLRTIEQRRKTYDEYIQEFKKMARKSSYKKQSLIKEFKRRLSGILRRKLTKAENPPQYNRRVVGEKNEAKQKPEIKQSKEKNIGEECSVSIEKYIAQRKL